MLLHVTDKLSTFILFLHYPWLPGKNIAKEKKALQQSYLCNSMVI